MTKNDTMTTKIYGIYGRTTAIVRVPTGNGKAFIEVEFNRGVPNAGPNYRPATFSTSDPIVQRILEKSRLFGSLYTIVKVRYDEDVKPAGAAKADSPKVESVPDIKTKEEAVAYLKAKGAKATNLKDEDSIKKFADKIGVSFPNLTI